MFKRFILLQCILFFFINFSSKADQIIQKDNFSFIERDFINILFYEKNNFYFKKNDSDGLEFFIPINKMIRDINYISFKSDYLFNESFYIINNQLFKIYPQYLNYEYLIEIYKNDLYKKNISSFDKLQFLKFVIHDSKQKELIDLFNKNYFDLVLEINQKSNFDKFKKENLLIKIDPKNLEVWILILFTFVFFWGSKKILPQSSTNNILIFFNYLFIFIFILLDNVFFLYLINLIFLSIIVSYTFKSLPKNILRFFLFLNYTHILIISLIFNSSISCAVSCNIPHFSTFILILLAIESFVNADIQPMNKIYLSTFYIIKKYSRIVFNFIYINFIFLKKMEKKSSKKNMYTHNSVSMPESIINDFKIYFIKLFLTLIILSIFLTFMFKPIIDTFSKANLIIGRFESLTKTVDVNNLLNNRSEYRELLNSLADGLKNTTPQKKAEFINNAKYIYQDWIYPIINNNIDN